MRLYRPVGRAELLLIRASGMRAFPPRLPEQPIFYPVLSLEYARQIARDWNAREGDREGHVLAFDVDDAHASLFAPQQVGSREHRELWVPAGQLDEFNAHIQGEISLVESFFGLASPPTRGES